MLPSLIQCSIAAAIACSLLASFAVPSACGDDAYDVVVYGGTSGGIAAAVQVKRMGGTVVVIEPSRRIGGLTTGGLGQTDIGNKAAIGGISREFYQRVRKYYEDPQHWKWQQRDEYRGGGQSKTGTDEDTMWTFEPSAALAIMQDFVREYEIPVVYQQRLDRTPLSASSRRIKGVELNAERITRITMESGQSFVGKVFVDASYEGDLLAGAGVSYFVGRESNDAYGETLSGVQTRNNKHHQLVTGVDPYLVAGDRSSGLLPGIDPAGPGLEGTEDQRMQAYCFRMCLTDHPDNRIPFAKPSDYDPLDHELLLRDFEAGAKITPWANSGMPNRKTDTNNNRGVSTDFIGQNYEYPDASYQQRDEIIQRHLRYQQGLMWTLANHPRVPAAIRNEVSRWGTCRDEFEREDGWQQQLYIREARRMVGASVMTQHHCQGRELASRPIGLAAYTMDSHNVQRYVDEHGHARNEGDVQVGGFSPYPIDYGSITPRENECVNLLVPVCLSASHMAFGSIRMEPVFMVLGQSAATAAMQSIQHDCSVQQLPYESLGERLAADKQVLKWSGPQHVVQAGIDLAKLPGIVVDDEQAERVGFDSASSSIGLFVATGYRHDSDAAKGQQTARFRIDIQQAGQYEVRLAWTPFANRATNVPVNIYHAGGASTVRVNQREQPDHGAFGVVGKYQFDAGQAVIEIGNADTDGFVLIDAVQLLKH